MAAASNCDRYPDFIPNTFGYYNVCFLNNGKPESELRHLFGACGKVEHIRFSKRYVFISYRTKEEAVRALDALGGMYKLEIPIKNLRKGREAATSSDTSSETVYNYPVVYIGNIALEASKEEVEKLLERYSTCDLRIFENEGNKKYASVKFETTSEASEAIKQLQNYRLHGRHLRARYWEQVPDSQNDWQGGFVLAVRHLPLDCQPGDLLQLFVQYGAKDARIPKQNGERDLYGFVRFGSAEDSARGIIAMDNMPHKGKYLKVEFTNRMPQQVITQAMEAIMLRIQPKGDEHKGKVNKQKVQSSTSGSSSVSSLTTPLSLNYIPNLSAFTHQELSRSLVQPGLLGDYPRGSLNSSPRDSGDYSLIPERRQNGTSNSSSDMHLLDMSCDDIVVMLRDLNMSKHGAEFLKNGVNGEMLFGLDRASLQLLGVTNPLEQAKLLGRIEKLKRN